MLRKILRFGVLRELFTHLERMDFVASGNVTWRKFLSEKSVFPIGNDGCADKTLKTTFRASRVFRGSKISPHERHGSKNTFPPDAGTLQIIL